VRDRDTLPVQILGDLGVSSEWIRTRLVDMLTALAEERRRAQR
jgi:hypothetical protein